MHKKVHKKLFYFTDINVCLLFHFFGIWLSVKYRDFLIITNLSSVPRVFILFYRDKLKVQHESPTLHFYVALFWKDLITIFNVGYTQYLIKDLLYN